MHVRHVRQVVLVVGLFSLAGLSFAEKRSTIARTEMGKMPHTVEEANKSLDVRRQNYIQVWLDLMNREYAETPTRNHTSRWRWMKAFSRQLLPEDKRPHYLSRDNIARIAAGLFAIKYAKKFTFKNVPSRAEFVGAVEDYFEDVEKKEKEKRVKQYAKVGTCATIGDIKEWLSCDGFGEGDFDMVAKDLISLIYFFLDDPDLLTDKAVFRIVHHALRFFADHELNFLTYRVREEKKLKKLKWALFNPLGALVASVAVPALLSGAPRHVSKKILEVLKELKTVEKKGFSETENHVLMIATTKLLLNQYFGYVLGKGKRPRPGLKEMLLRADKGFYGDPNRFSWSALRDFANQITARALFKGMFETNGKPYSAFSFRAIQNLYTFAFSDGVVQAAKNNLDYLAAKFAFQTIEGKRFAPSRRSHEEVAKLILYRNDKMQFAWGLLSGANRFPQTFLERESGSEPLWAAILHERRPYKIPAAIHDYMLDKHSGFWARMFGKYRDDHDLGMPPRYFRDGKIETKGTIRVVPEAYFVTNEFMNVSGGRYERYHVKLDFIDKRNFCEWKSQEDYLQRFKDLPSDIQGYDFLSAPQVLVSRGWAAEWEKAIDLVKYRYEEKNPEEHSAAWRRFDHGYYLHMRGEPCAWYKAENTGTYKNFSYGYLKTREKDRWPQFVPKGWEKHVYKEKGEAVFSPGKNKLMKFKVYDLRDVPDHGFFVITGHFDPIHRKMPSYPRGFFEVVPARIAATPKELKDLFIKNQNAVHEAASELVKGKVADAVRKFFDPASGYWYAMTVSGEVLRLKADFRQVMLNPKDQDRSAHGRSKMECAGIITVSPPLQETRTGFKLGKELNANELLADCAVFDQPLLEVREVGKNFNFTGRTIAYAKGDGKLWVENPCIGQRIEVDSSDYRNPKSVTKEIKRSKCVVRGE